MLCLATLVMIEVSWPLWVDGTEFPRVPFLGGWPRLPAWCPWVALAGIAVSLVFATIGRAWRAGLTVALVLLAVEVIGDQSRLQPWVYQFGLMGLVLILAPSARALGLARVCAISLYVYSGLSKLDAAFLGELGPTFLDAGLGIFGSTTEGWPRSAQVGAILAMPAWEVAVAAGLCFARTRRWALVGAVAQHSALLLILGPGGLGHSGNVLIWNLAMIAEDWVLFWPRIGPDADPAEPATRAGRIAAAVVGFAVIWPATERLGLCDSWPGHALYASHSERVEILVPEDEADRLPAGARSRLGPADFAGWRRLDLAGWSRDVRGVPVYPQARVGLGVAEALASTPGVSRPIRVILRGRAGLWDGRRDRAECQGRSAMSRQAARFWINAHPAVRPGGPG